MSLAQAELAQLRDQNRTLTDRILHLSRQFEELNSQLPTVHAQVEQDAARRASLEGQIDEMRRAAVLVRCLEALALIALSVSFF